MLKDIIDVHTLGGFRLGLKFEDGVEGIIDVSEHISFQGIFEPLKDPAQFKCVRINRELGSIEWPNGADLDPDVLYARITGGTIETDVASARQSP